MKYITLFLSCACVCACASAPKPAPQSSAELAYIDPNDGKPPTDFELTVEDTRHSEQREIRINDSNFSGNMETVFQREQQQYTDCITNSKRGAADSSCQSMLKEFCSVDEYVDGSGQHYRKPYCPNKSARSKFGTINKQ